MDFAPKYNFQFYNFTKNTCFIFCFYTSFFVYAQNSSPCAETIARISSIGEFVEIMSKNGRLEEHQSVLFEIYRANGFGDVNYETHGKGMDDVFNFLKEHPGFDPSKLSLRERIITFREQFVQRDKRLNDLLQKFINIHRGRMRKFLVFKDNFNFWAHMLSFPKPESSIGLSKPQRKSLKQKHREKFLSYMSFNFFSILTLRRWSNRLSGGIDRQDRILAVVDIYRGFKWAREQLEIKGKNIGPISEAMVYLVEGAWVLDKFYLSQLKDSNALTNIEGLKNILEYREAIALELGFDGGFSELKEALGVSSSSAGIETEILKITNRIEESGVVNEEKIKSFRLRSLSLYESPFRSCLGKDCATWRFFELGLDPNFLFFTLTDSQHRSVGQATIVLGSARDHKGRTPPTAFLDNIHNVSVEKIYPMLEGIRLMLLEYGYELAVTHLSDLSNDGEIRDYFNSKILPELKFEMSSFMPHMREYEDLFRHHYYRDYEGLVDMMEFEGSSAQGDHNWTITLGEQHPSKSVPKDLSILNFRDEVLDLASSEKEEDQIRFLKQIVFLNEALLFDKEIVSSFINFEEEAYPLIISWIKGEKTEFFSVRKLSLYTFLILEEGPRSNLDALDSYLTDYFTEQERELIMEEMDQLDIRGYEDAIRRLSIRAGKIEDIGRLRYLLVSKGYWKILYHLAVFQSALRKGNLDVIDFFIKELGVNVERVFKSEYRRESARKYYSTEVKNLLIKNGARVDDEVLKEIYPPVLGFFKRIRNKLNSTRKF